MTARRRSEASLARRRLEERLTPRRLDLDDAGEQVRQDVGSSGIVTRRFRRASAPASPRRRAFIRRVGRVRPRRTPRHRPRSRPRPGRRSLGRLAGPRLEELQVGHEAPRRSHREALGDRRISHLLVENLDLGDKVRPLRRDDALDLEPPRPDDEQVVAAVLVRRPASRISAIVPIPVNEIAPVPTSRPSRISTTPNGEVVSMQCRTSAR